MPSMSRILDFIGDVLAQLGALIFVVVGLFAANLWLNNYMRWTWTWGLVLIGSAAFAICGFLIRQYANRNSN